MGKKKNSYTASYKLKVISFAELQEYLNKTQIMTSTKKKIAYFTHPDFSAAKIEKKSAQITRANTICSIFSEQIYVNHFSIYEELKICHHKCTCVFV
jgi:hypothetical protein